MQSISYGDLWTTYMFLKSVVQSVQLGPSMAANNTELKSTNITSKRL